MCGVPSHVKDVQTDRQLGSAATLCRQLARLVNSNEISASSGSQGLLLLTKRLALGLIKNAIQITIGILT